MTEEDVVLYNKTYVDYMKNKKRLGYIDERVEAITAHNNIHYDMNDVPLSKAKYRSAEVKEDFNALIGSRQRFRGSLNNIPLAKFGGEGEALVGAIDRRGRSSLVPFRLSFGSNISGGGALSEKA